MTASTLFDAGNAAAADAVDRVGSRPDFAVLGYPVISMTAAWTHQGSKTESARGDTRCRTWRSGCRASRR